MADILEKGVEGSVKFYRVEDGYGFLRKGEADVFFHASNLLCTAPYEDEQVIFDIKKSSSGSHEYEAVNVSRAGAERITGDVLEYHVEPGSWRTDGLIMPLASKSRVPFSERDLKSGLGRRNTKPRPWHAATFSIVRTSEGPRAVDIELDTRYPLQRFAHLGREEELIRELKRIALSENWEYRSSTSQKESPILYNYLQFTFAKLCDEDRELLPDQKKIRVRKDLSLATFNTGLVDEKYKSIYALFEGNDSGYSQVWKFRAFCIPGERHGKLLASHFNPLPDPAEYFHSTAELLYDPDVPLHPDYTHILTENRERLPQELLNQVQGSEESMAIRTLSMYFEKAVDVAKKRARWNYKTAIPHYYPSFKRLEFLLPLCLVKDDRVDVALSVQKADTGYLAYTILTLDWAYKSARLVCRPDSDWLAPEKIEEETKKVELDDVE